MEKMKVLLISHNPISTSNNMGKTLKALFSQFDKNELCQLYIHPSHPDVDACNAYYRITDREALKGIYTFRTPGGEVNVMSSPPVRPLPVKNKNSAVSRLGRDTVWKLSHWYSKRLKAWLDREAPTHIFLAPGYAKFIYDIALRISKDRHIPIVTYICDDYCFVKQPPSLMGKLQLKLLQKKNEALMKKTACLVAICDEIKKLYGEKFDVPAVTIMTGSDISLQSPKATDHAPASISYFGNVRCNRYLSLCEVGQALSEINRQKGTAYTLKIYTNEQDPAILKVLSDISTIQLCGFVTGDAFREAMASADLLLHTEAFDEASIDLVKRSVSTKIADSLASGIPLIAYGPEEVASMKHLLQNKCALVATSKEALHAVLIRALTDTAAREQVVACALKTAEIYHDDRKNSLRLKEIFNDDRWK